MLGLYARDNLFSNASSEAGVSVSGVSHLQEDVQKRTKSVMDSYKAPRDRMKVLYCTSWGYQKYFYQVRNFVSQNVPELAGNIDGDVFPPSTFAVLLNQIVSYIWFGGLIYVFAGKFVWKLLGIPENNPVAKMLDDNRNMVIGGLFLLNTLSAQMLSSGAFEVYLNDELIFSKLVAGRVPSAEDIVAQLAARGFQIRN